MNVIWIVADTFRWDRMGAYGNDWIKTPALDSLAAQSVRFDRHFVSSFPTVPARADHHTGKWTMSFMGWEPLPSESITVGGHSVRARDTSRPRWLIRRITSGTG